MLSELAHFNNARRYARPLLIVGAILAALGLVLIGAVSAHANGQWLPAVPIPPALGYLGASLLIAAGGFVSTGILTVVRHRLLAHELQAKVQPDATSFAAIRPSGRIRRFVTWSRSFVPKSPWRASWPQVLVAVAFGLLAISGVIVSWRAPNEPALDQFMQQIFGGALLAAAFPLLVLQRTFANVADNILPEAPQLDRLLRLPLTVCLGLGIAQIFGSFGFAWPLRLEQALAILVFAIALELILRCLAVIFVPFAPMEQRRSVADSSIAGLLRLAAPSLTTFNSVVTRQFGIDLSRSWAVAFVQKAFLPIFLGMIVLGWCITGITALSLDQRGVYERFGEPVAVFGPGLHVHLPWPMGIIRSVEFGTLHDIPIALTSGATAPQPPFASVIASQTQQPLAAEGLPPLTADRLWDASHPSEQSYLIASETRGQQSFQIVNADLRMVYRIGLSDKAALDSAYRIADHEALVRTAAGQLLVQYFSKTTLLAVLGQNREAFSTQFRNALQAQLDRSSSGIEMIAVIVEAIHPPSGAASAYHNVQAAEILANSQISLQRAQAIRTIKSAQQAATQFANAAVAASTELVNQARSESVLFEADRRANEQDGQAFLLERRFERLANGLKKSEFIVIDHRLNGRNGPTIDLRGADQGKRDILPPGKFQLDDDANRFPPDD
jgi:regulator of protease activity HflC (stomatin/prohibitin superfamily)